MTFETCSQCDSIDYMKCGVDWVTDLAIENGIDSHEDRCPKRSGFVIENCFECGAIRPFHESKCLSNRGLNVPCEKNADGYSKEDWDFINNWNFWENLQSGANYVLYLRPFGDEPIVGPLFSSYGPLFSKPNRSEVSVISAFAIFGTVITVSHSHDQLHSNALRLYFRNETWQERVAEIMVRSRLVVFSAGESEGVIWEFIAAQKYVQPERLIFTFGEWHWMSRRSRQRVWEIFKLQMGKDIGKGLPASIGNACLLYFEKDWTPHLVSGSVFAPIPSKFLEPAVKRIRSGIIWARTLFASKILVSLAPAFLVYCFYVTDSWSILGLIFLFPVFLFFYVKLYQFLSTKS